MTDQLSGQAPPLTTRKDARVRVMAEKADRKAARPWFRRKRFLLLPMALIATIVIIQVAAGRGDSGTSDTASGSSTSTASSASQGQVAAGIGTKVRDGKFEFVVTGVHHPGKTMAGKVGETLTARGVFVIVSMNVTNIGKQSAAPDCMCQLLFNDKGEKLKPSSAILSTKDALRYVQMINPGQTAKDVLVLFDVAVGTNIVNVELHDSALSQGVKVNLS